MPRRRLRLLKIWTCSQLAAVLKLRQCVLSPPKFAINTRSGVLVPMLLTARKQANIDFEIYFKLVEQQIVMPSAAWSRRDVPEGAVSICFVELKKAPPTTPVFVNKNIECDRVRPTALSTPHGSERSHSYAASYSSYANSRGFPQETCMSRQSETGKVCQDQMKCALLTPPDIGSIEGVPFSLVA